MNIQLTDPAQLTDPRVDDVARHRTALTTESTWYDETTGWDLWAHGLLDAPGDEDDDEDDDDLDEDDDHRD